MKINRRIVAIAAVIAALAAGGAGIAYAVGGDDDEQVTGPSAEKAKAAALDAVGGGTVLEVERQDGDGEGAYEVEVERPDGSQVEVHVSGQYDALGTAADDDRGGGPDDDDDGEDGS
jgi:Peptidase propeptide and YPEB domain